MCFCSEGPLQLGQPEAIPPRFVQIKPIERNFVCTDIIPSTSDQASNWQFFFYSVENLLPPPDSAFQLGDLFPMVKVINPEVSAVFISKKGGFRGHFESRYHQVMKNFLWLGCRFPLCVHKTKSLGLRGEYKSRWGGRGGAGGQESLLEGLAHWGRDCWGFYCLPFMCFDYSSAVFIQGFLPSFFSQRCWLFVKRTTLPCMVLYWLQDSRQ